MWVLICAPAISDPASCLWTGKDGRVEGSAITVFARSGGTFKPVFQAVFHNNEELLQGRVVRIQSAAEAQGRFNEAFDAQLSHVQQVGSLHSCGVSRSWKHKKAVQQHRQGNEKQPNAPFPSETDSGLLLLEAVGPEQFE